MTKREAIGMLSDGHAMYTLDAAQRVLETLVPGAKLPESVITRWKGQDDANPTNDPKGLSLYADEPGAGVASLTLGYHVCRLLKVKPGSAMGRGFQARLIADAIAGKIK